MDTLPGNDNERIPFSPEGMSGVSIENYRARLDEHCVHGLIVPLVVDADAGAVDFDAPQLIIPTESTGTGVVHDNMYKAARMPTGPNSEKYYVGLFIYPSERLIVVDGLVKGDTLTSFNSLVFATPLSTLEEMRALFGDSYRFGLTNLSEATKQHRRRGSLRPHDFIEGDDRTILLDRLMRHAQQHANDYEINGGLGKEFLHAYIDTMLANGFTRGEFTIFDMIHGYAMAARQQRVDQYNEEIVRGWEENDPQYTRRMATLVTRLSPPQTEN